jgi:3-deoxy-D-manno-octulosonic-acid transferase
MVLDLFYFLGLVISSPLWLWRLLRTGKWRTDWWGRLGHCRLPKDWQKRSTHDETKPPTLLLHAVSVGEVNALRLLVQELEKAAPHWRIVISSTTNTGIARARELYGERHPVVRFPLDFSRCVRRFLKRINPDLVALAELEVWPNFMRVCRRRQIPVCIVNGRLSQRSFKRYKRIAPLVRPIFAKLTAAAVQTEDYAQRFMFLGLREHRMAVTDSMKWDTAQLTDDVPGSRELARAMGIDLTRPIVVAGSTAPGEDKLLIDSMPAEAQLVLVPRKPEWFDAVAKLSPGIIRRSEHGDDQPPRPIDNQRLFLLDTIGELRKAYALATVCVVGRSFLGLYGSDMIEPIALGKPTIIGTHHSDFADIMIAFTDAGGIVVTNRPGQAVKELLAHPQMARGLAERGRRVIVTRQGATRRHVELLLHLMPSNSAHQ